MRVFVTGGTGAIGKFLLPLLVENKYEVVALTRSITKAAEWAPIYPSWRIGFVDGLE